MREPAEGTTDGAGEGEGGDTCDGPDVGAGTGLVPGSVLMSPNLPGPARDPAMPPASGRLPGAARCAPCRAGKVLLGPVQGQGKATAGGRRAKQEETNARTSVAKDRKHAGL